MLGDHGVARVACCDRLTYHIGKINLCLTTRTHRTAVAARDAAGPARPPEPGAGNTVTDETRSQRRRRARRGLGGRLGGLSRDHAYRLVDAPRPVSAHGCEPVTDSVSDRMRDPSRETDRIVIRAGASPLAPPGAIVGRRAL